ncbi:hypothetical protein PV04_10327 [Phialophora macrospora]|uniref:Uncharacterized protein n=1 Tax=Phialophora macrospora TaxID=1851006 RepID=A0A0D2FTW5_9EURO|nr:hypothetical protein PV04_10327 [Phialophora macrospora]
MPRGRSMGGRLRLVARSSGARCSPVGLVIALDARYACKPPGVINAGLLATICDTVASESLLTIYPIAGLLHGTVQTWLRELSALEKLDLDSTADQAVRGGEIVCHTVGLTGVYTLVMEAFLMTIVGFNVNTKVDGSIGNLTEGALVWVKQVRVSPSPSPPGSEIGSEVLEAAVVEFSQVIDHLSLPFESDQQAQQLRERGRTQAEEELDSEEYEYQGSISRSGKVDKGKLRTVDPSSPSDPDPTSVISSDPDSRDPFASRLQVVVITLVDAIKNAVSVNVVRQSVAIEDQ